MRIAAALLAAALGLAPGVAGAVTLEEAIELALAHAPAMKLAAAQRDAAAARVNQARAEGRASLVVAGQVATGSSDLGGFFGFGSQSVSPRSVQLLLQQPLFTGGAVAAGVAQARAGDAAAEADVRLARLSLRAEVAAAYVGVIAAQGALELNRAQLISLAEVADQARLRFDAGEVPSTDVAQAAMRRAAARAGVAEAEGGLAVARARYRALVGEEPVDLVPAAPPAGGPASLDEALAAARQRAGAIQAAQARLAAAEGGVRRARAAGSPTVALTAQASSVRDEFLPGYRADGALVGVQARWPLYTGGRNAGKVAEAVADRRAAEAGLEAARSQVDRAVIEAWQARVTADALAIAAGEQVKAAKAALYGVENEVRVGQKPTLDLLDAQRDDLAAAVLRLEAEGARTAAAYRLLAAVGDETR